MNARVVLIHDDVGLRKLLADLLRAWVKHRVEVEEAGYDVRLSNVWQRWLREADLFVLGLDRHYEQGVRAEGVTVAEQMAMSGKRVLVVGSECSGGHVTIQAYWDIGSDRTFLQSVDYCLQSISPAAKDIEALRHFFKCRLNIPTGH